MWHKFLKQSNAFEKNYFACSNSFPKYMIEEFEVVNSLKRLRHLITISSFDENSAIIQR